MPDTFTTSFGFINSKAATPLEILIPMVDYANDYSRGTETTGEVVLHNTTTPIDQAYDAVFSCRTINNIYDGIKTIDPVFWAPYRKGLEIRSAVRMTLRRTNTTTGEYYDFPVTVNVAMSLPVSAGMTAEHLGIALSEAIGHLAGGESGLTDLSDAARLNELIRRTLKPADVR